MTPRTLLSMAALVAAVLAPANAAPITTPPPPLFATGDVKAIYVFANARNTSFLDEASPVSWTGIFCNHPSGSCVGNTAGNVVDLGTQSGALVFGLRNVSTGNTYWTNAADADGAYHAVFATDYSTFGLGALPVAAATALAGLANVTFIAWEDRDATNGADFDYNDLVFAFSNTASAVPEPLSLSLFGVGLLGLAGLHIARRRWMTKAA